MFYESVEVYLESSEDLKTKIERIDVIIDGLYTAIEKTLVSTHLEEYQIDNGQSRIRTHYRSVGDMEKGILAFEKLKTMLVSRLNKNRVIKLRHGDTL